MRSRRFTVRFPHPVYEGACRRQERLSFDALGEYLTNLVRCDLILQRDHDFTLWLAAQTHADQDFIDDCLTEFAQSVPGSQPTLTAHFCHGIIAVQMARHACNFDQALGFLPVAVRALCAAHGFN